MINRTLFFLYLFTLSSTCAICQKKNIVGKTVVGYIPFTVEIYNRILQKEIDIQKVQFYIDQDLLLEKISKKQTDSLDTKSGQLYLEDHFTNESIKIPKYTPCVCEVRNGDTLYINLGIENSNFIFIHTNSSNYFTLAASNWNNGTADIIYNDTVYRIVCESCSNAGDTKLLIEGKKTMSPQNNQTTAAGKKVSN